MKFISFIIATLVSFTFLSCYKDEGLDPQTSANWIANKNWTVTEYTVTPPSGESWIATGYATYVLEFYALQNGFKINTGITERSGAWSVYEGAGGNILQIYVPEVLKDVYQLSGSWLIVEQTMNTLVLTQEINGTELEMRLTQIQ